MKKVTSLIIALITALSCITACRAENTASSNILVAYFSCTGTTERAAESIAKILGADIIKIEPAKPYTSSDLNYNSDCRANREQNDDSARPEITGSIENIDEYDAIFIGYPIWWGKLPKIMYTFLESYDLSGKMIIPFCTSGGSGISTSVSEIKSLETDAEVNEGRRITSSSETVIKEWLDTIELPAPTEKPEAKPELNIVNNTITASNAPDNSTLLLAFYNSTKTLVNVLTKTGSGTITVPVLKVPADAATVKAFLWDMSDLYPISDSLSLKVTDLQESEDNKMRIRANGREFTATLEDNETVAALKTLLPMTIDMTELNGNEKFYNLSQSLPTNTESIGTIQAGDIMLWGSDCIVIFYKTFNTQYSYTRIGHIDDVSELTSALGSGGITVTIE